MKRRYVMAMVAGLLTFAVSCSEPEPDTTQPNGDTTAGDVSTACDGLDLLACARLTSIADLVPDEPQAATGEPLTIGMVNQENTPVSSFPELSAAAKAAAAFINDNLGGVNGRPLNIEVCNTGFSAEGSAACGQRFAEAGVPAVLGGIDVFGNAIDILADSGIPYAGGVPISTASATAPNSFQWSGGTWAAAVAFAHWATTELDAKTVSVIYGDFGSISDAATDAQTVLESRGVTTQLVPHPIITTDLTSPMTAAMAANPDALIVLTADTGCKAAYDAARVLNIDIPTFYTGACAAPDIIASVPPEATEGNFYNVEGDVTRDDPDPDFSLYFTVLTAYDDTIDPIGATTVTFRSLMNLWVQLVGLDDVDAPTVTEALASQRNTPSFMGHPYTCNGEQIEGLPAMCAPQQIVAQLANGELVQRTGWVDVGRIYDESR